MISGIDFIQLPVSDMQRARLYYEGALGLTPSTPENDDRMEYPLAEGPSLALFRSDVPAGGGSVGIAVSDFKWATAHAKNLDILDMDPFETDGCHGGPIHDSEGNGLILHQRKDEPTRDGLIDFIVLPVADMARARAFYEGKLGLAPDTVSERGWTEYVLPDGAALALFRGPGFEAATGSAVALKTPDPAAALALFEAEGLTREGDGAVTDTEGNWLLLRRA